MIDSAYKEAGVFTCSGVGCDKTLTLPGRSDGTTASLDVALPSEGAPVVAAWVQDSGNAPAVAARLRLTRCKGTECGRSVGGTVIAVPPLTAHDALFVDVAVTRWGMVVAHASTGRSSLALTLCTNVRCDNPQTLPIGATRNTGGAPPVSGSDTSGHHHIEHPLAMDVNGSGQVAVVYRDAHDRSVTLATCSVRSSCADLAVRRVTKSASSRPGAAEEAGAVEVEVHSDGRPVLLLRTPRSGRWRLVTCAAPACRESHSESLPPRYGSRMAALALSDRGLPVVATFASPNGEEDARIDLVVCSTRTCRDHQTIPLRRVSDTTAIALTVSDAGMPLVVFAPTRSGFAIQDIPLRDVYMIECRSSRCQVR